MIPAVTARIMKNPSKIDLNILLNIEIMVTIIFRNSARKRRRTRSGRSSRASRKEKGSKRDSSSDSSSSEEER